MKNSLKPICLLLGILFFLVSLSAADTTKTQGTKKKAEEVLKTITNPTTATDPLKAGAVRTYPVPENYSRYSSSPCFKRLGYSPYTSDAVWEERYCDCERSYYINLSVKIVLGILLLGAVGYMVYLSQKRRKNEAQKTADNVPNANA